MTRSALLLAIARTDTTFALATLPGRGVTPARPAWRGRVRSDELIAAAIAKRATRWRDPAPDT